MAIKRTVGIIVKLKMPCLGNPKGTLGVCYEEYGTGLSFIFENGMYDGFSTTDYNKILERVGFEDKLSDYHFRSVIYLADDYRKDFFKFAELRNKYK